jgi:hypothetical protein
VTLDWQLHDHPAACVIAQQYSTATYIPLLFHSGEENFEAFQKCHWFHLFLIFKDA